MIVRTAAEGASEEELTRDVERLTARWTDIESKVENGNAPQLLYGEPDLTLKVVRDLFTEDFAKLVVSGDDAWDLVDSYVEHVAPDLADRLERYSGDDVFADYRIDEQIAKGLDRKVWLPSGGSLIIDRTEAMTVVDVNTGKFTGSGGNLEETVTKNNLEAAEEIVRQLRLRDIGGIIVIDFIDMVLESNRDLVLRRLVECLGRDRTRHQVAEVTSLGLVQMTRKRIGTGLLEAFSENCDHCQGRGVVIQHEPVEPCRQQDDEPRRGRRGRARWRRRPRRRDGGNGSRGRRRQRRRQRGRRDQGVAVAQGHRRDGPARAAAGRRDRGRAGRRGQLAGRRAADAPVADSTATSSPVPVEAASSTAEQGDADALTSAPVTPEPIVESTPEPEPEPAPEQAAEPEPAPEPVVPTGPRLVTSSRRRVARRPAGPPAGTAAETDGADRRRSPWTRRPTPAAPTAAASPDGADGAEAVHVPVKSRRSRKR